MKVGLRRPSVKRSVRARTTGKWKRRAKRAVNPFYGRRGIGFIKNPKRAVKGAVYRRLTFSVSDVARAVSGIGAGKGKRATLAEGTPSVEPGRRVIAFWATAILAGFLALGTLMMLAQGKPAGGVLKSALCAIVFGAVAFVLRRAGASEKAAGGVTNTGNQTK